MARFLCVRGGIAVRTARGLRKVPTYLDLHRATGGRFSWGLVSGGTDLHKLIANRLAHSSRQAAVLALCSPFANITVRPLHSAWPVP
jgi:hypothetical protein